MFSESEDVLVLAEVPIISGEVVVRRLVTAGQVFWARGRVSTAPS